MTLLEFFPCYLSGIWLTIKIGVASLALGLALWFTLALAGAALRRVLR